MTTAVQVRKAGYNLYDVFLGVGYDNWSRVRRQHWGLQVVNGNRLTKHHSNVVRNIIQDHPDGSLSSFEIFEEQQ